MDTDQLERQLAAHIASAQLAAIIQREGIQDGSKAMDHQAHLAMLYTRFLLNHLDQFRPVRS